jgi:hypothetical protein
MRYLLRVWYILCRLVVLPVRFIGLISKLTNRPFEDGATETISLWLAVEISWDIHFKHLPRYVRLIWITDNFKHSTA